MLTEALLAGAVNWLVTLIITSSRFSAPLRRWVGLRSARTRKKRWQELDYFLQCHLCTGVWVGFGLAAFWPSPLPIENGVTSFVLWALVMKGVGHIIFMTTDYLRAVRENHDDRHAEGIAQRYADRMSAPTVLTPEGEEVVRKLLAESD